MLIGGVLLAAGSELKLIPGDYLGDRPIRFVVEQIIETRTESGAHWVVLIGLEQPSASRPWQPRQVQVRVNALARSLALI